MLVTLCMVIFNLSSNNQHSLFLDLQNVVDLEHEIILFQLHDEGRMLYGIFIAQVAHNQTRSLWVSLSWMLYWMNSAWFRCDVGLQTCFLFYFVIFRSTVLHSKKESVKTSNFIGQLPAFVLDAEVTMVVGPAVAFTDFNNCFLFFCLKI